MHNQQPAGTPELLSEQRKAVLAMHFEIAFAETVARAEGGWIGQKHSPLGRLGHIEAVRRRVSDGRGDAAIYGRLHLLTVDALAEEYFRPGRLMNAEMREPANEVRA